MAESPIIEQLRRHIHDYVEGHECYGTNGHDQRRPFVPQAALTAFWTREKIIGVLCHDGLIPRNPDIILDYYIAIFTIVVLTSEPANIDLFMQEDLSDSSLPLGSVPEAYRESLVHHGVFEDFMKLQWKFCPMSLDVSSRPKPSRKNMSPEIILPISNKIKINPQADEGKDIAVLYKVDLHRNCTQLTVPVVFKEYRQADSESQRLHDNEWAMYSNLRDGSFRHIVTYYGSFGCMGRRTIVLEYAPGGTLLQFFKERQPPKTDCHRVQFWQNLFGLLGGLEAIDDFTWDHNHSKDTWRLRGTHQDIRLQNILVCGTSSDDDYSVPFKFADMGNAHIRKTKNEGIDRRAVDQYGNGMYSAPEAFRDNGDPINIDHKSDVWSLGAILSEALIWSIWGERGREIYQDERIQRTRQTKLKGGHHEGAFHDGDRLLDVVENWHERVISVTGGSAEALSKLITESMLAADTNRRKTAADVFEGWITTIPTLETGSRPRKSMPPHQTGWPTPPLSFASPSRRKPTEVRNSERAPPPTATRISSMQTETITSSPFTASPAPMNPGANITSPRTNDEPAINALNVNSEQRPEHLPCSRSSVNGESETIQGNELPTRQTPVERSNDNTSSVPSRANGTATPQEPEEEMNTRGPSPNTGRTSTSYRPTLQREGLGSTQSAIRKIPSSYLRGRPNGRPNRRSGRRKIPTGPATTIDSIWSRCFSHTGSVRQAIGRTLGLNSSDEDPLKVFPELKIPLTRLRGEGGRNQIFVLDDSNSMESSREQLGRTLRVLSKLLKKGQVDPDKEFELYFASTGECKKARHSTDLQSFISTHSFSNPRYEMHAILDQVATKVIKEDQMVSIYVLTNGHWNPQDYKSLCGVDKPIERLVRHIVNGNKQDNWAIVQFIGFHSSSHNDADQCGKARMRYLDNDLNLERDIVDNRDARGNVRKILLGSFSAEADESESSSED